MQTKFKPSLLLLTTWAFLCLLPTSLCARGVLDNRLSVAEAEQLVGAWVKNHKRSYPHELVRLNASQRYRHLQEITPQTGWERLGVQVFQSRERFHEISGDIYTVFIKNSKVYPLNTGHEGMGVTSLCVCEQTPEGKPGLVYTYESGSGVARAEIAMLLPGSASSTRIESLTVRHSFIALFLEKQKDKTIRIYARADTGKSISRLLLGRLVLMHKNKRAYLHVALEPNMALEPNLYIDR